MRFRKLLITTGFILTAIIFFLVLAFYYEKPVSAATSCPSNMNPDSIECLDYLRSEYNKLLQQQGSIQNQLSSEQYKQLSLEDKISYMENQITQTEKLIKSLEVEIAADDIEIKLLTKDIQDKEDAVSLMKQEISILEETVNQRVTESYKYSYLNAFDLILDSKSFSNILRKTKYLIATRSQDIASLEDYSQKAVALKKEEESLSAQKTDLEVKQNAILTERDELASQNSNLETQVSEKNNLLQQSYAKAQSLQATYDQNLRNLSALDSAIIAYISKFGDQAQKIGTVSTGTWIGRMGNTGKSDGAHLHFSMRNSWTGNPCSGNVDILGLSGGTKYLVQGENSWRQGWDGWWWPYIYPGSWIRPIAGPTVIMSQNYHQGMAVDLISYKETRAVNYGAPIYAVMGGELYRDVDGNGGIYAYIRHPNGWTSCYLHIQQ